MDLDALTACGPQYDDYELAEWYFAAEELAVCNAVEIEARSRGIAEGDIPEAAYDAALNARRQAFESPEVWDHLDDPAYDPGERAAYDAAAEVFDQMTRAATCPAVRVLVRPRARTRGVRHTRRRLTSASRGDPDPDLADPDRPSGVAP